MKNIKNLINFSINDARVVCAVADLGTSAKVSHQLNMTQSLVNATIVRTEEKLGVVLFERDKSAKQFLPTPEAKEIIPTLKAIAQLADRVHFPTETNEAKGKVKITSSHTILEYYLGPFLKDLIQKHPEIDLLLKCQENLEAPFQELHEIDITYGLDDRQNYKYFPYHSFRQKFWASQDYIDQFGFPEKLEDLDGHTFLSRHHTTDPTVIFGSKMLKSEIQKVPKLRICEVSGVKISDYLCQTGCGIAASAEESLKIGGINLINVLPDLVGDVVDVFVKIHREFAEHSLGKFMINWIFQCRNSIFEKHNIRAAFPFTFLK